jgi:hypothetical protein
MNKFSRLNLAAFATACAALTLTTTTLNAGPLVNIQFFHATAGATVVSTNDPSTPGVLYATVTGVVQTFPLGNCVENAQVQAHFPANPTDPVVLNGTATLTALNGTNSLILAVSGTALPDPANPFFYNAKYQITITGGTGAYAGAKGLAENIELVMFTSPLTATINWNMTGFITTTH